MAYPSFDSKRRFMVLLAILLAGGFLATTLISYYVARDSLERHIAEEMLPLTGDNVYSEIQRDLLRPVLISSLMAHDTFVRDWALGGEKNSRQISSYLAEIQKKYGTITAFFVSDETLRYYHAERVVKVLDPHDPLDDWYFRLRNHTGEYEINIDDDTADRSRLAIFINYRVMDYLGRFIGVTGVGLSVDSVVSLIESYQRRYGRVIYFVNRQGDVTLRGRDFDLAARLRDRPGLAPHVTRMLTVPSTSFTYLDGDRREVYVNSRLVPEFDWYLIVEQHSDSGKERIDRTLIINILLSLVVTALVSTVAHFTLRGYQRRLVEMATTDKLTGTLNRQAFENLFDHAVKRAGRQGQPLTLAAIDIDNFKRINDTFGHQGGDKVIREVAALIAAHTRDCDVLCRWGGEEFILLLEGCSQPSAWQRAEALRRAIRESRIRYGRDELTVTISIGVAEFQQGETLEALVNRADGALYVAKREGRDRVKSA